MNAENTTTETANANANPLLIKHVDAQRNNDPTRTPLNKDQLYKVLVALASVPTEAPEGYLTAREIAAAATSRNLPILAENVRKVLRTRATTFVESRSRGEGVNRVTEFRLNDAGRSFFNDTYPFA
ncbi:MAG: hypothetical protein IT370_15590 [Deltaproteobacteria bacterium]|nr:hypothetical protein [Deltaproteobacteria bacterium]